MFWYHDGYHGLFGFYGFHGFWLISAIIAIIPFWKICERVGLSPFLSLLLFIPLANIIFVYYVAFAEWPAHRGSTGSGPSGFGPTTGTGPSPGAGSGPSPGAGSGPSSGPTPT